MSIPSQRRAGVYVRLVRLDNCVVAGVVTMAGGYLAVGPTGLDDRRVITAALVVIGAAAAANAVNDRVDAVGDAIGAPHRPIPSGAISLDEARRAALMLGGSSVALAFSIGPIFAVAAGALLGIGVIYSYRLKGVPVVGHSTVALLSASTVVYGAAAAGTVRSSVLIGSALVVCFIFVGEVLGCNRRPRGRCRSRAVDDRGQESEGRSAALRGVCCGLHPPGAGGLAGRGGQ